MDFVGEHRRENRNPEDPNICVRFRCPETQAQRNTVFRIRRICIRYIRIENTQSYLYFNPATIISSVIGTCSFCPCRSRRNRGRYMGKNCWELSDFGNCRWCFEAVCTGQSSLGRRRWHGTHCPHRLLLRDETRQAGRRGPNEDDEEGRTSERERERVRQAEQREPGGGQTSRPRLFPPCPFPCFSPFVLLLLFLLLLSFARVSPGRGPCRVKTTYVPGEAHGSRSAASGPTAFLLSSPCPVELSSSLVSSPAQ